MNRKQYIEKLRVKALDHSYTIQGEMIDEIADELEAMDVVWVRPTLIKAARREIRACESIIIAERRARGLSVDTPETRYRKKLMGDLEAAENTNE